MGTSDAGKVIGFGVFLALAGFGSLQLINWVNGGYALGKPAIEGALGVETPEAPLIDTTLPWAGFIAGLCAVGGGIAMHINQHR